MSAEEEKKQFKVLSKTCPYRPSTLLQYQTNLVAAVFFVVVARVRAHKVVACMHAPKNFLI